MPLPLEIRVSYAEQGTPIPCHSVAEMEAELDRLHTATLLDKTFNYGHPLSVAISIEGHEIYIGLGDAQSYVMIGAEPYDAWHVALADEVHEGEVKVFYGVCQDSYWSPENLIPVGLARRIVRYFVENQQLSTDVKWQY